MRFEKIINGHCPARHGWFSLSQFTVAGFAVAQFALDYSLIAQFGFYIHHGQGQFVKGLNDFIRLFA